jgi:uncharacterized protein (UPF0335 family)
MTTESTQTATPLTAKELFKKLCSVHAEIETLSSDLKELLAEGKEADLDTATINSIAKASTKGKVSELEEKSQLMLDTIDELTS